MPEKLKPCPFCGNTHPRIARGIHGQRYVVCETCGAYNASTVERDEKRAEQIAVKKWNMRAALS